MFISISTTRKWDIHVYKFFDRNVYSIVLGRLGIIFSPTLSVGEFYDTMHPRQPVKKRTLP